MKRVFTLLPITATAAAGLALLAASSFSPVQATTFPGLRLIYVATGVADFPGPVPIGTTVACVNLSGQTATVRWTFRDFTGTANFGVKVKAVPNGSMWSVGTKNGTKTHVDAEQMPSFSLLSGQVRIFSTQSGVFCSAIVARSDQDDPGNSLRMVRFNAHPGTIE
jgi:hypothetical protein